MESSYPVGDRTFRMRETVLGFTCVGRVVIVETLEFQGVLGDVRLRQGRLLLGIRSPRALASFSWIPAVKESAVGLSVVIAS